MIILFNGLDSIINGFFLTLTLNKSQLYQYILTPLMKICINLNYSS